MKLISFVIKQDVYEVDTVQKSPEKAEEKSFSNKQKYIYSLIHMYIHLVYGLSLSTMSPAFVDFKHILNTEMEWIGLFPTFQAIGTLVGSALTVLYKWVNRQIVLSVLVVGMGLGTIFQPWSTELWHLYLCIFVYGLGIGVWNGANNVILIEMWQSKSPSYLQFSQFIYGIGTVLGPLLSSSYVLGDMICPGVYPEQCEIHPMLNLSDSHLDILELNISRPSIDPILECSPECLNYDRRSALKVPFLVAGLLVIVGPLIMFTWFFIDKYEYNDDSNIEIVKTDENIARHKKYVPTKTILACIAIFFAFGIMSENMYTDFAATFFQYQRTLHLSAETSAEIFASMSVALSVGRFLSVFIAMYAKPHHMIAGQLSIIFFGYIFQILGQDNLIMLWSSAVIICFGYSSIFICLFSFVGQYMEVTDKVGGLFIGAYNSIYLFLPYFIAEHIPKKAEDYLYLELGCISVGIVVFIIVMIAVRNVPDDLIRKLGPAAGH